MKEIVVRDQFRLFLRPLIDNAFDAKATFVTVAYSSDRLAVSELAAAV